MLWVKTTPRKPGCCFWYTASMPMIREQILCMLKRLKKDKARLLLLLHAFENEIKILKVHELTSTPLELAELYRDSIKRVHEVRRMLRDIDREFDKEFVRVEAALSALDGHDVEVVKTAFAEFILSDVAFSKRSLAKTFLDYEELLKNVRKLYERQPRKEDDEQDYSDDGEVFSKADYEAVKQIAIRNGGTISNEEILSVIVRGYTKLGRIKEQLIADGIVTGLEDEDDSY